MKRGSVQASISAMAHLPSVSPARAWMIWLFRRCNSPVRFSPAQTSIKIFRRVESARTATSSSAKSRNVPRSVPVSIQGPSNACTAAPNSTSSNGFFKNCSAPFAPRSAMRSGGALATSARTRVSGKTPFISPKNAIAPGSGGSKSRMMSSGLCSSAKRRASASEGAA